MVPPTSQDKSSLQKHYPRAPKAFILNFNFKTKILNWRLIDPKFKIKKKLGCGFSSHPSEVPLEASRGVADSKTNSKTGQT